MIAHVVFLRPRGDLSDTARAGLAEAMTTALREIPSIRRGRFGRRITHGRPYEMLMREDYPFAAVLEFDDMDGLRAYLDHPAHGQLAERFFESFEQALMYDFELRDGEEGVVALQELARR